MIFTLNSHIEEETLKSKQGAYSKYETAILLVVALKRVSIRMAMQCFASFFQHIIVHIRTANFIDVIQFSEWPFIGGFDSRFSKSNVSMTNGSETIVVGTPNF